MPEHEQAKVYLNCGKRWVGFVDDRGDMIKIRFSVGQQQYIDFISSVAVAQHFFAKDLNPTSCGGVDFAFCETVALCLNWSISPTNIRNYWGYWRSGRAISGNRSEVIVNDSLLDAAKQKSRAIELFVCDNIRMWLGKRTERDGRYTYWPIVEIEEVDQKLRRFVDNYCREHWGDDESSSSRTEMPPSTSRLYAPSSSHEHEVVEYLQSIQEWLSRLPVLSKDHPGTRDSLYVPRLLLRERFRESSPQLGSAEGGPASGDRVDKRSQSQATLLEELLNGNSGSRACILGDAGCGKSTLLEDLAWHCVNKWLTPNQKNTARVPFLVSLSSWKPGTCKTMQQFVADRTTGLSASSIDRLCRGGQALILLDGLDEVPDGTRRELQQWIDRQVADADMQRCAIVLAGRPWAFDWGALRAFRGHTRTLAALGWEDIESYVRDYFNVIEAPHRAEALLQHFRKTPSLQPIVRQPLLLMLCCYTYDAAEAVHSEAELFEGALRTLIQTRSPNEDALLQLLGRLAWLGWSEGKTNLPRPCITKAIAHEIEVDTVARRSWPARTPESILDTELQHSGIISRCDGTYQFTNPAFLEYLAGRHLARSDSEQIRSIVARHLWNPQWQRLLIFTISRLWSSNRDLALRLVQWVAAEINAGHDDAWHSLALLAGRLLAPCGTPRDEPETLLATNVTPRTIEAWRFTMCHRPASARQQLAHRSLVELAHTAPKKVRAFLMSVSDDPQLGTSAVEALAMWSGTDAVADLRHVVQHGQNAQARAAALEALVHEEPDAALKDAARELRDPAGTAHAAAVEALTQIGSASASTIEALISAVSSTQCHARSQATEALAVFNAEEATQVLEKVLREETNEHLRQAAAVALGEIGDPAAVRSLEQVGLAAENEQLRECCMDALARIASPESVEVLIDALRPSQPSSIRFTAVRALSSISDSASEQALVNALSDREVQVRIAAVRGLATCDSSVIVAELKRKLGDKRSVVRKEAARALGLNGAPHAVDDLEKAVGDKEREVATMAAMALVAILGNEGTIDRLITLFADSPIGVRRGAPWALQWLGSASSARGLIEQQVVPQTAVEGLRKLALARGTPALVLALRDDDPVLRARAAEALGSFGADGNPEALVAALTDADWSVRRQAAQALGKTRYEPALDPLLSMLEDPSTRARSAVVKALGEINAPGAVDALLRKLQDPEAEVRASAVNTLVDIGESIDEPVLIHLLNDASWAVRYGAARALQKVGSDASVDHLIRALRDAEANVRWQAAEALARIGSARALPKLQEALHDSDRLVCRAATLGLARTRSPDVLKPLLELTKHDDPNRRGWAAEALGMLGQQDSEVLRGLMTLLSDETWLGFSDELLQVSDKAADALALIAATDVVPQLLADLSSPEPNKSGGAYKALRSWHPKDNVIKQLVDALCDTRGLAGQLLEHHYLRQGETVFPSGQRADLQELQLHDSLFPAEEDPKN